MDLCLVMVSLMPNDGPASLVKREGCVGAFLQSSFPREITGTVFRSSHSLSNLFKRLQWVKMLKEGE